MAVGWYVVEPPSNSMLGTEAKKVKVAFVADLPFFGPLSPSGKKVQVAFTAHAPYLAQIQAQFKKVAAAFNAKQNLPSALAVNLKKVDVNFAHGLHVGTFNPVAKKVAAEFNGLQAMSGALAVAQKKVAAAFTGRQTQVGSFAVELKKASAQLNAINDFIGTNAVIAKKVSVAFNATAPDPFTPVSVDYGTPGDYTFQAPAGSGYKLDRVALGPGHGGRNYGFGVSANGGRSGLFAWDTLTEGVHFTAGQTISIHVAQANPGGNPSSEDSTITVNGNTLTGARNPDGSWIGGHTGQSVNTGNSNSNRDLLYNGVTYAGSVGGSSSAHNSAAGTPPFPGGGGWGSNSNGIGGRPGGNGKVWLRFYAP